MVCKYADEQVLCFYGDILSAFQSAGLYVFSVCFCSLIDADEAVDLRSFSLKSEAFSAS